MTTYIERLIRWIYPKGNWGRENPVSGKQSWLWGQMWVHLFIGVCSPLIALPIVAWWPLCGLSIAFLIGLITPLWREFHVDKHPFKDLYVDTPEGIDCRSDILSCWVGSVLVLIPMSIMCILMGI